MLNKTTMEGVHCWTTTGSDRSTKEWMLLLKFMLGEILHHMWGKYWKMVSLGYIKQWAEGSDVLDWDFLILFIMTEDSPLATALLNASSVDRQLFLKHASRTFCLMSVTALHIFHFMLICSHCKMCKELKGYGFIVCSESKHSSVVWIYL